MNVFRYKTAILRRKLSKPVKLAAEDGLLTPERSFFDYGCGRGEDLRILKKNNFQVSGFDPHFYPGKKQKASVVNLGYVINVIESPEERKEVLKDAFDLADDLLIVSVMLRKEGSQSVETDETPFNDGIITSWNTFQKYFTHSEIKDYIIKNLTPGVRVTTASPGVYYVFKNQDYYNIFLNERISGSGRKFINDIRDYEDQELIKTWLEKVQSLGRIPAVSEYPQLSRIIRIFGSKKNLMEAFRYELNEETFEETVSRKKQDLLLKIAETIIEKDGRHKAADFSDEIRTESKAFFGNLKNSSEKAFEMLRSLADKENLSRLMEKSEAGKLLPDDLYVHKDSLNFIPVLLRLHVRLALKILPDDVPYDIIKIARNSWHITFLEYPDFYTDPHPVLKGSMKIELHKNRLFYRDYSKSENPPILHRKDTFLHSAHPLFEKFSQLSISEEEAGLLGSNNIGHKIQWELFLKEKGWSLDDHTLNKV